MPDLFGRPSPDEIHDDIAARLKAALDIDELLRTCNHSCPCGKLGNFGFGVSVRNSILGRWFCFDCSLDELAKPVNQE